MEFYVFWKYLSFIADGDSSSLNPNLFDFVYGIRSFIKKQPNLSQLKNA